MKEFEFYSDWKIILPREAPDILLRDKTRSQVIRYLIEQDIVKYKLEKIDG